jgi:hypothetical protein
MHTARSSAVVERPVILTSVALLAAAIGGVALGVGTQVLQGHLPGAWSVLANSAVAWALAAFLIGMAMPTLEAAIFGGALSLVVASVSYYGAVDWFEGSRSGLRSTVIWSAAGIVAGAVFAAAGYVMVRVPRYRAAALGLVTGALIGEGGYLIWRVGNVALRPAGVVELVLGLGAAVAAGLGARRRDTPLALIAAVVVSTVMLMALATKVINAAFLAT